MELLLAERDAELVELNDRITVITELQQKTMRLDSSPADYSRNSSQVQIESDVLDQLVSLSRTAGLAEYLQESFNLRTALVQNIAAIKTRLQKMSGSGSLLTRTFIEAVSIRYSAITDRYRALLFAAQQTAQSETHALYAVMSQFKGEKLVRRRDFLLIALAQALGGMLAVIGALLWPVREVR